ncbi:ABC-2 type transport system ATP-binding protein [Actinacidiphila yanglinensis]|uniref:ABC-2 type transport system ATP-binding protein n=1 Tax=Actinacidiphila yanglinensis TaxID=310779 RepID=A0A1H6DNF5_9ACTN|nr:ATP-binding cassette domain-containing protein [Actinacidiphila yanglinensis]SEG86273.1 ABC-2 type transport system ATP-binding protein [Actinacidiphila yanglinensis]
MSASHAIEVSGLRRSYGSHTAVRDVSFQVRHGAVTGFLGPNGAGKSTTLRMLVGLTTPDSGQARVLGSDYRALPNPGRHVGVLLDASAQHSGRTGREVLALGAMAMGLPPRRADELLEVVGLDADEARRRTGTYSLGMRQRLGIAHALLGDPRVLVLDEPANGLDPGGIHWLRTLLREFADRGGCVLLSSHLLREVEVIADLLIVIGRGRVVAQGAKQELLAAGGTVVRGSDAGTLAAALAAAGIAATRTGDAFLAQAEPEQVARAAAAGGVVVLELRPAGTDRLESLFLQLTADDSRETVRR